MNEDPELMHAIVLINHKIWHYKANEGVAGESATTTGSVPSNDARPTLVEMIEDLLRRSPNGYSGAGDKPPSPKVDHRIWTSHPTSTGVNPTLNIGGFEA